MILSGSAVHVKGLGSSLCSSRNRLMAACRSTIERKTPRFNRRFVSLAKNPSMALSQDAEVGVKWKVQRGWRVPLAHIGMFVGRIIVDDGMDRLSRRNLLLNGVKEANEFLMAMALHVAADHRAVEHVERREQRRRAVSLIVVRHGPGAALLQRQTGLGAVERLNLAFFVDR